MSKVPPANFAVCEMNRRNDTGGIIKRLRANPGIPDAG